MVQHTREACSLELQDLVAATVGAIPEPCVWLDTLFSTILEVTQCSLSCIVETPYPPFGLTG